MARAAGSSPRKRGTPASDRIPAKWIRIIPAQAGNARPRAPRRAADPDHPRASGERQKPLGADLATAGSSPRKRGTPRLLLRHVGHLRIIPAQAGNAQAESSRAPSRPDHPRASGERTITSGAPSTWVGSSPRKRGTQDFALGAVTINRIIPAQAGNASLKKYALRAVSDHPRASGERGEPSAVTRRTRGSSPRKRGTRGLLDHAREARRIIPAQAGNAPRSRPRRGTRADHPRASGERFTPGAYRAVIGGSSPRKRGTRKSAT